MDLRKHVISFVFFYFSFLFFCMLQKTKGPSKIPDSIIVQKNLTEEINDRNKGVLVRFILTGAFR